MENYKLKYVELRNKFLESTDLAYRLGYEKGLKDSQVQQLQQQLQQAQQQNAQMQQTIAGQQQNPNDPNQGGGEQMPQQDVSNILQDQNVATMPQDGQQQPMADNQGLIQPQGQGFDEPTELDQYIGELEDLVSKGEKPKVLDLRKKVEEIVTLRKSHKAKMKANKPQVISAQKKLVDNILTKWEKEAKSNVENIEDTILSSGLEVDLD